MSEMSATNQEEVRLPLSGAVIQTFNFNAWPFSFTPSRPDYTINPPTVGVGFSSHAKTETDVLKVASYGKQLGRIGDALCVLLKKVSPQGLSPDEKQAIKELKEMLTEIAGEKKHQGRKLILWPPP
jgi:hypothetical protein